MKPGGVLVPRVCICCGEEKGSRQYSWNGPRGEYVKTCKECGQWLFLFRKVFGPVRNAEVNRIGQRRRNFESRITERPINIAGRELWNAWHPTKDSNA